LRSWLRIAERIKTRTKRRLRAHQRFVLELGSRISVSAFRELVLNGLSFNEQDVGELSCALSRGKV
jgi:hypothetical protein